MATLHQRIAWSTQEELEMVTPPEITVRVLVRCHADAPTWKSPPICFSMVLSLTGEVYWWGSSRFHLSYVGSLVNREFVGFHS
jgi:hypothetical protein